MDGLFRFLVWLTGHRQDAEDALQEVLVRGFRAFDKLRERDKFKSWIYKIAANTGRTTARRSRRGMKTFGVQPFDDAKAALLGSEAPVPFAQLQAAEADEKLARALETLEPELREPLLLHTLSGMKYREVAETLGWPIGTVTTRIHAARERLAKLLK
jgi:RNA polymerase sigma-70 factor (ECF subfamily)